MNEVELLEQERTTLLVSYRAAREAHSQKLTESAEAVEIRKEWEAVQSQIANLRQQEEDVLFESEALAFEKRWPQRGGCVARRHQAVTNRPWEATFEAIKMK